MTFPTKIVGSVFLDLKDVEDVVVLDGSTAQYIIRNPFDWGGAISAFTIEMWIETADLNNAGTLISYAVTGDFDHIMLQDYRNLDFTVKGVSSGATGIAINDVVPHHVVIKWQASDGAASIEIDGHERWSGTLGTGSLTDDGSIVLGLEQGSVGGTFSNGFIGEIWDVRIWTDIRTADEVFHYMNHRLAGTETGLRAYWKLDEGADSNADDSTANNLDGTINGSGIWTTTAVRFFTDVTAYVDPETFGIASVLTHQIDTSEFTLENAGAVAPTDWDEVAIYDGALSAATRIFGGSVTDSSESEGEGAGRDFDVGCGDYGAYLDHVFIKAEYESTTDAAIIEDLFETYAMNYDPTTFVEAVRTHEKIRFNRISLREIMDILAELAQGDWYVDYERRVHFFVAEIPPAPHGLSDSPDMVTTFPYERMRIKTDGAGVINRVEVVGGNYLSDDATFYLQGTGQDPIVKMPFKMHGPEAGGALDVWRNDGSEGSPSWTSMTVKVGHIDSLGGANEVLHYFQEQNLEQQANWPALPNAIKIFGRYEVPLRARVRDQASFNHYKLWFDAVINNPDIVDKTNAKLAGKALIAKSALGRVDVSCRTREPGLRSGMRVPFTNANAGISGDEYMVQRAGAKIGAGGFVIYDVKLGAYSPDLIDVFIKLARAAKSKPIWRDDEVLDELLEEADVLEFVETTHAPVPTTDPYHWGPPLLLRLPFDGDADDASGHGLVPSTESGGIIYPPHVTPQVGSGCVQLAEATTNHFDNPSFEVNTSGWSQANSTLSRYTGFSKVGNACAKVVGTDVSDDAFMSDQLTGIFSEGDIVTFSVWGRIDEVWTPPDGRGLAMRVYEVADGDYSNHATSTRMTIADTWIYHTITLTCRADHEFFLVRLYLGDRSSSRAVYWDAVQAEKKDRPSPYCDGSLGTGHSWSGAAHASTSSRTVTSLSYAITSGAQYTIAGWVRFPWTCATNTQWSRVFGWGSDINNRLTLYCNITNDHIQMAHLTGSGTDLYLNNCLPILETTPDTWVHFALTYDGTTVRVYQNGIETGNGLASPLASPATLFWPGEDYNGGSFSNGWHDEYIVLDHALDATEVAALHAETLEANLIALYKEYWETENSKALFNWDFGSWG